MFLNKKKILLISHELSNTGAPKALYELARFLIKLKYNVSLISFEDGPIKKDFRIIGVKVFCLKEKQLLKHSFFLNFFDLVICNTILCYNIINKFKKKNILWWIHEAIFFDEFLENSSQITKHKIIRALNICPNIYCVSEYAKTFFKQYNQKIKILEPFIEDKYYLINKKNHIISSNTIKIAYIGALIPLKGQDIFLTYINNLDINLQKKLEITFIGIIPDEKYKNYLREIAPNIKIFFTNEISNNKTLELLKENDIFVLLSKGDSFSIATAEAMMLDKKIIISDKVGLKELIEKEKCGFVISNSSEFSEAIDIYLNNSKHKIISPRKIFLETFSSDIYSEKVNNIINKIIQ